MPDSSKYVDHPAPSAVVVLLMLAFIIVVIASIPDAVARNSLLLWVVLVPCLVVCCFYLWPFSATYYTVSAEGIQVQYGPWKRGYPWPDFTAAYWQKGMFATRIGWPSVTPCVRLTDAVLLKRRSKWLGLYLTPNDSRAFLRRVAEFAPDLTKETMITGVPSE